MSNRMPMDCLPVLRPQQAHLCCALLALLFTTALRPSSSQEGACTASGTNPCGSGVCSEGPGGAYTCQCASADGQVLFRSDDGTPSCGDFYGECHRPLLCGAGPCIAEQITAPDGTSQSSYSCSCAISYAATTSLDGNVQCLPGSPDAHATGRVDGGPFILPPSHLNPYSRHWSLWYTGTASAPDWWVPPAMDWRTGGVLPPVQNTFGCGASWAFAAAAAIDSAWAITHSSPPPLVSRQQFLDCTGATPDSCQSGHPGDAFEHAARLADAGSGLRDMLHYQYVGAQGNCTADIRVTGGNYSMGMYERISTGNWKQLAAAVTAQPVVVSIVGSFPTFLNYTGQSVYSDVGCYSNGGQGLPPLDHSVLVVGYSLPAAGQPFWIIQNSWGTAWGDQGYGYLAIQKEGGDTGICGMHVAPALYPVVRGPDPCAGINPCGNGTCASDQLGGYQCACPDLFVAVTSKDWTQTCAPADACVALPSNPCAPGSCVTFQDRYQCQCPRGFEQWAQGVDFSCRVAHPRLTGYNVDTPILPRPKHLSVYSRHYSAFFSGNSTKAAWRLPRAHDWRRRPGVLPPVMNMGYCGASWAFSAAAAIDSAWALTHSTPVPQVSRQELLDCVGAADACALGSSQDAFEYAASITVAPYAGLSSASDYPYRAKAGACAANGTDSVQPKYGISLYEQVGTDSWRQLAAAVARQPLVVALVGSYPTFARYSGRRVYSDQGCYNGSSLVDHSVLLVGFSLPQQGPPFWIIQNSWGQSWGDKGYGYIKIQAGDGICGIQLTPAVYPVVQPPQPCQGINPCGGGKCTPNDAGGYRCKCPGLFSAVTDVDGTQTCAPVNVCSYKGRNPCGSGHCVNDGRGFFKCLCTDMYRLTLTGGGDPTCDGFSRVPYVVQRGDTCDSIASWSMANKAAFENINQHLDCSSFLDPGTRATIPRDQETCHLGLTVQDGDTPYKWCHTLYPPRPPEVCLAQLRFDFIDPGEVHPVGSFICAGLDLGAGPGMCNGQYRSVALGDTCVSLYIKYFKRNPSLYTFLNGSPCSNSNLWVGRGICIPK